MSDKRLLKPKGNIKLRLNILHMLLRTERREELEKETTDMRLLLDMKLQEKMSVIYARVPVFLTSNFLTSYAIML